MATSVSSEWGVGSNLPPPLNAVLSIAFHLGGFVLNPSVHSLALCANAPVDGDLAVQFFSPFAFSVFSVPLWLILAFAFSADRSLIAAMQMHKLHGGGLLPCFRRFVPFQRHAPSLPPTQNVNSADHSLTPVRNFGRKSANCAIPATLITFLYFHRTTLCVSPLCLCGKILSVFLGVLGDLAVQTCICF